jgi:hypothetical protein
VLILAVDWLEIMRKGSSGVPTSPRLRGCVQIGDGTVWFCSGMAFLEEGSTDNVLFSAVLAEDCVDNCLVAVE